MDWIENKEKVNVLESKLKNYFGNATEIKSIFKLSGGFSNLSYKISCGDRDLVLRTGPPGAHTIKKGHDMQREFTVLQKLNQLGFKQATKVYFYEENTGICGSDFFFMEFQDGIILRPETLKFKLDPETARHISYLLCKTQAELHQVDVEKSGLIALGKPQGYILRQLNLWYEKYQKAMVDPLPFFEETFHFLNENLPQEIQPGLIHNDYKFDNVVFSHDLKEIISILDWEMCTVGDCRMDLGTSLSYWVESGEHEMLKMLNISHLEGMFTKSQYARAYLKLMPHFMNTDFRFFLVFGYFKNAVVVQQIYKRYHSGFTTDPKFKNLDKLAALIASMAHKAKSFSL
jgi:aminoglycoside phosphotransferase (APT) family kinase protein